MAQRETLEIASKYISFLIQNNINVQKALLFGSYANGNNHVDSDIDIAVIIKNPGDLFKTQVSLIKLTRNIDTRIEPHPFDEKDFNPSDPFATEILKSGIEIKF